MDRLREMEVFAAVAATGSLSAAARRLNLSIPVVSKQLAAIERRLGARLINRTTRKLALTDDGLAFYERCKGILAEVADAEQAIAGADGRLTGTIRITAPVAFGRAWITPLISKFALLHPELSFHLQLTDTIVDLLDDNIDLALRMGDLADSSLRARRLVKNQRLICGSPAYLKRRGVPATLADLEDHDCIAICGSGGPGQVWRFTGRGDETALRIAGRLSANNGEVAYAWVLAGLGLAQKSVWDVADDLQAGRLTAVLTDYRREEDVHAVFPPGRQVPHRATCFVDFLTKELQTAERKVFAALGASQKKKRASKS
jgi:DNA-binding transcriptional LysR family regulator